MNRNNELEKHLLSRSYETNGKIEQLLETRYSITGGQKPIILFKQVGEPVEKSKVSLLEDSKDKLTIIGKNRIRNTRLELRTYIQQTLNNQRRLVKKIQVHRRSTSKPFPLEKYLRKYDIPRMDEFVPMRDMWQQYMQNLLFSGKQQVDLNENGYSLILPKLASADFNGCFVTVIRSKNTLLVGLRGIVVWDAQHSLIVVVPREQESKEWNSEKTTFSPTEMVGGFRMVPKKGTLFGFDVLLPGNEECIGFTMVGSRFEFRSVDRSGKKFKSHNVDDL